MIKKYKKQVNQFEKFLLEKQNREFQHEKAVCELKAAAHKYNDPVLNECINDCISIIFNQDATIAQIRSDKIFERR